jgi:hypothetical protein
MKMSPNRVQRKTCNDVNIRQSSSLRAAQARQSSTTRATSGHAGTTSIGVPLTVTAMRPRLKLIASSNPS